MHVATCLFAAIDPIDSMQESCFETLIKAHYSVIDSRRCAMSLTNVMWGSVNHEELVFLPPQEIEAPVPDLH
jgi:hypothetical protein